MRLQELAEAQFGVVGRRQLGALGLSPTMVRDRLDRGSLVRLHRGVYAVGHRRLRREGIRLAAVFAAGPGAVLSHRDAAGLHGIRPANHRNIDVTVDGKRARAPGIALHRATLTPDDVTQIDGIPVTTLARTLVDLASVVPRDHLTNALNAAERNHRVDVGAIELVLERARGRNGRGHRAMRAALAEVRANGPEHTRSELELLFLGLVERNGLPRPRTNVHVHGQEVDAWWPQARLAVEIDSWAWHRTRRSFQRDRAKTNLLVAHGIIVLRFTDADVADRPREVAAQLTGQLQRSGD
ncbi:type IV toxin-antitoxin system AbiEi family antitoxin domain-containing protein [Conexibacter woesei]|nr:type IV toxin-antitoxin system AbiEi family antitoxin domain-containing protein [Conexibacter woesei]